MNLTEIKKSLERQFDRELTQGSVRNIVFWYDEDGVFADSVDTLTLDNVKIIKLYDNNMFAVKLYIEETDTGSNLLVYSPMPRPANRENWLTDTIKYSQTFSTDETSNNLINLKIDNALRSVVEKYNMFFRREERSRRFVGYGLAPYTEPKIDLGVLSVLCKLPAPNLDNVVRVLLSEMAHGESKVYDEIGKFGNLDAFWTLVSKFYGYNFEEQSLEKLAILLLVSHFSHGINGKMPNDWQIYVSDNPNCYVFADNFMKNSQLWEDYNALADYVSDKLRLSDRTEKWTIDEVADCDTFEEFDKSVISRITTNITQNAGEYEHYCKVLNIETLTMLDMARRDILPAAVSYQNLLAQTCINKQNAKPGSEFFAAAEEKLLTKLSELTARLSESIDALEKASEESHGFTDNLGRAKFIRETVFEKMAELRRYADEIETLTGRAYWPLPSSTEAVLGR